MNINKVFLMGRLTADPELRVSFRKGSAIIAFGSIQVDNWKDKDGKNQRSTKVIVEEVQFGERRSDSPSAGSVPAERKEPVAFSNSQSEGFGDIADVSDDDLPF